eukprot:scaffold147_cov169-Pinguiococcus_pyrenoidosus.AAC.3
MRFVIWRCKLSRSATSCSWRASSGVRLGGLLLSPSCCLPPVRNPTPPFSRRPLAEAPRMSAAGCDVSFVVILISWRVRSQGEPDAMPRDEDVRSCAAQSSIRRLPKPAT